MSDAGGSAANLAVKRVSFFIYVTGGIHESANRRNPRPIEAIACDSIERHETVCRELLRSSRLLLFFLENRSLRDDEEVTGRLEICFPRDDEALIPRACLKVKTYRHFGRIADGKTRVRSSERDVCSPAGISDARERGIIHSGFDA